MLVPHAAASSIERSHVGLTHAMTIGSNNPNPAFPGRFSLHDWFRQKWGVVLLLLSLVISVSLYIREKRLRDKGPQ